MEGGDFHDLTLDNKSDFPIKFYFQQKYYQLFYVTLRRMKITYFGAESLFMVSSWVSVKADLKREEENNIQHYTRKRFENFLK